jgi:hypothetical protein
MMATVSERIDAIAAEVRPAQGSENGYVLDLRLNISPTYPGRVGALKSDGSTVKDAGLMLSDRSHYGGVVQAAVDKVLEQMEVSA